MKVQEVLDLAEEINKIVEKYNQVVDVKTIIVEDVEALESLARLQGATFYGPKPSLPCYWSTIQFGAVKIELESLPVEFEFKIKNNG